jgi:hypothetical protein
MVLTNWFALLEHEEYSASGENIIVTLVAPEISIKILQNNKICYFWLTLINFYKNETNQIERF